MPWRTTANCISSRRGLGKSLFHTVLIEEIGYQEWREYIKKEENVILIQHLIMLTQRNVIEAMSPLLLLISLTTDIKQFIRQLPELERCLRDSRRLSLFFRILINTISRARSAIFGCLNTYYRMCGRRFFRMIIPFLREAVIDSVKYQETGARAYFY